MSSYQVKQIKMILIVAFSLMIAFYFFGLKPNPLPSEIMAAQKNWTKKLDLDFKNINDQRTFLQWAEKQPFEFLKSSDDSDLTATLETLTLGDSPCNWSLLLKVTFGMRMKGGGKQFTDKVIVYDTSAVESCPTL